MSNRNEIDREEERVEALVDRALGGFVPTTEAEVARAEEEGVEEVDLPASLRERRAAPDPTEQKPAAPRSTRVVSLEDARQKRAARAPAISPWLTHGVAIALGAAAAALLVGVQREPTTARPAGNESAPIPTDSAPTPEPSRIVLGDAGVCPSDCCGGSECSKSASEMKSCPSGRSCISCSRAELTESQYRFRVGGLAPSEMGKKDLQNGSLEVCARVAASDWVCAPAHSNDAASNRWIELPLVATGGDNLAGATVAVRFAGAKQNLAEWSQIIPVNAAVLCKGLMIEPKYPTGESIGAMSLFLDDSHWVELGRGPDIETIKRLADRFDTKLELRVFETKQGKEQRFALAVGPFAKPRAEKLRWVVLDAGGEATTTVGSDYVGDPRPAP